MGLSLRLRLAGVVSVSLLMGLVGCGSGSHLSDAQRIDACVNQNHPGAETEAGREAITAALTRMCRLALRDGDMKGDGTVSFDTQQQIAFDHPDVLAPICEVSLRDGLLRLPAKTRSLVHANVRQTASDMCRYVVRSGGIDNQGNLDPLVIGQVLQAHPRLGEPFLYASLMGGYDPSAGFSRGEWSLISHRLGFKMLKEGLVTTGPIPTKFNVDPSLVQALLVGVVTELRSQGRIQ